MTFLVAEIGVNWDGDFELVKEMMTKSKQCGFNAVKFQAFNEELVKSHPQIERLMKSTITESNVGEINNIAKDVDIEWFCTPMYTEAIKFLEPFVNKFKMRFFDSRNILGDNSTELIEKMLDTKKQIIISTDSIENTKFQNNHNVKWLYCVPNYPTKLSELDFSNIKKFDGYSNHCTSISAPITASILGAEIIEVHITSDKNKDFVDNNVSFDYHEMEQISKYIHEAQKIKK